MPTGKGVGLTPSEQHLAEISDSTFLALWSWPNVFKQPGKELCDLLVVCGDDVLIFSDKKISWPNGEFEVAYKRWFRRAIDSSVDQIRGAARWLSVRPADLFADAKGSKRLPLTVPPIERRRVHGICVASGAEHAASKYFNDPDGTFFIRPDLKGAGHLNFSAPAFVPFSIGDVDPQGPFIHVFNQQTLSLVMRELDTISDFTEYLNARADFLRSGRLLISPSEAELLANYIQIIRDGKRNFPTHADVGAPADIRFTFVQGEYAHLVRSREYRQMKIALKPSYQWDKLIKNFTDVVLTDRQYEIFDTKPTFELAERALRIMAREPRNRRLALGEAFSDAMTELERQKVGRFARVVKFDTSQEDGTLAYVFVILKGADEMEHSKYRRVRTAILETYVMAVLCDDRKLNYCVGIALNAISDEGSSEDLIVYEQPNWDPELEQQVLTARHQYEIMIDPSKQTHYAQSTPSIFSASASEILSRKDRRAAASEARKKRKRLRKYL